MDAFFCAVEELRQPHLRGKAFAVGGRPEARGVVSSCSYAARQFGVHSAMPMAQALRACPEMIVLSGNHADYGQVSRQVMEHLNNLTPLVEQVSIDEAFLDVSDLPEPGLEIATRLQHTIIDELHLPCSLGIASNKLVAKIATDYGKAARRGPNPPCAITVVPPGEEAAFLAPLSVSALWGVGPKTARRLEGLGIKTIGDLASIPEDALRARFGKNGLELARHARGISDSPVVTSRETKSISQETTFEHDIASEDQLKKTLRELSEQVGRRLRKNELRGSTVRIKIRWSNFTTLTRQVTLGQPTDQDLEIYRSACQLFEAVWPEGRLVRLIGVGVSHFGPPVRQLSLWDTESTREHRLLEALDSLHERFGSQVIRRGKK